MNALDLPDGIVLTCEAFLDTLRRPPRMSVDEWADEYRRLPSKGSAEHGQWRTRRTPYLRAIMEALSPHHPAHRVVFMAAAQVGKTEVGLNWVGYVMARESTSMLCVQPIVELGELWSKQRLQPMIDVTPVLKARVSRAKSRDSSNTTLLKEFPGGLVRVAGANSAPGLAAMPVRFLFLDEIDRYPLDLDGEGDPISIAEARTTTYVRRKVYLSSTPTVESLSRINREYQSSNQQRYLVRCPHCEAHQALEWDNLRWPEGNPEAAQYACAHCGALIPESYKPQMLAEQDHGGHAYWQPTHPEIKTQGFHINALYTPIGLGLSWGELAEEWEKKKGDHRQRKVFHMLRLGMPIPDPEEKIDWEEIKARSEDYRLRSIPRGCLVLTAGIDVQKDRIPVHIRGYGRGGHQCWTIDYTEIPGDPTQSEVWRALSDYLLQPFINAVGIPMRVSSAAIDAGYLTDDVLLFTRLYERRYGWFAVKGVAGKNQIISAPSKVDLRNNGAVLKRGAQLWPVGVDAAKERLFARLSGDREQALAEHRRERFSTDLDDEFFAQLTAEVYDPIKRRWIKQRARNEALDTAVYAHAAALHPRQRLTQRSPGWWDELERQVEPLNADLFSSASPTPPPPLLQTETHAEPTESAEPVSAAPPTLPAPPPAPQPQAPAIPRPAFRRDW